MSGAGGASARRPAARSSFGALYALVIRMQVTPVRIAAIAALGGIAVLLAFFTRADADPLRATAEVVVGYGLGLVLPLATLWLATASIGDLVDDRLLVYLWLKPVARWQLPAAAILATATVVVPLVVVPLAVAVAIAGTTQLIGPVVGASVLAVLAGAGVFVAAGLWLRRALWWGLLYILVWENGLTRLVNGAARLSIASYAQSLVANAAGVEIPFADRAPTASVVVPLAIASAGFALAVIRYRRAEID